MEGDSQVWKELDSSCLPVTLEPYYCPTAMNFGGIWGDASVDKPMLRLVDDTQ